MPAAITFLVSFILLSAFLTYRFLEEKRGVRSFARQRAVADDTIGRLYYSAVMWDIPPEYRREAARFLHRLAHDTLVFLVESLRSIEKPLLRLSYRMRHSVSDANGKQPSSFLKTITPEKKEMVKNKRESKEPTNTL